MLKLAGTVLDIHDDVGLTKFRKIVSPTQQQKLAEGVELLQPEELEAIPDGRFGGIFYAGSSPGDQRRAFPMHTPEHTKLSALYFMDADPLPDPVRCAIAAQLAHGFEVHGVDPAEVLAEKTAEFVDLVSSHGEWAPGDNFIDVELYDEPEPQSELYAVKKASANGTTAYILPCDTAEDTRRSIEAIVAPDAMERLGLDAGEIRQAAGALKFAAEHHGVSVPDPLVQLACIEPRPGKDIASLVSSRLDYMSEEKRASKKELIKTAMAAILSEDDPATLVAKIAMFDKACGIGEAQYMRGCLRPMDVVFVPGATKEASAEEILVGFGGLDMVKEILGDEAAAEFKADPKGAFARQDPEIQHILRHART